MKQQLRKGLRDGGQWFRVGVVSATVITPLLSRWRSLRAAERARALWEARRANTQWPWTRGALAAKSPVGGVDTAELEALVPPRAAVRPWLWLAGVGIGLAAAGGVAFVVARRRLLANEAPVDIPWPVGSNGQGAHPQVPGSSERARFTSAVARGSVGVTTSAEVAPGLADDDESLASGYTSATSVPLAYQSAARDGDEQGVVAPLLLDGEGATVIGDTYTQIYRDAGAANLPAPDRRIYFESVEQAEASGYHPEPASMPEQPDAGDA